MLSKYEQFAHMANVRQGKVNKCFIVNCDSPSAVRVGTVRPVEESGMNPHFYCSECAEALIKTGLYMRLEK